MPTPIDINSILQPTSVLAESAFDIEILMEAQADHDGQVYKLLAERRAQLENAEILRRARAL